MQANGVQDNEGDCNLRIGLGSADFTRILASQ